MPLLQAGHLEKIVPRIVRYWLSPRTKAPQLHLTRTWRFLASQLVKVFPPQCPHMFSTYGLMAHTKTSWTTRVCHVPQEQPPTEPPEATLTPLSNFSLRSVKPWRKNKEKKQTTLAVDIFLSGNAFLGRFLLFSDRLTQSSLFFWWPPFCFNLSSKYNMLEIFFSFHFYS